MLLLVLSIFTSYQTARMTADSTFEHELEEAAWSLVGHVQFENGHFNLASPEFSKELLQHHGVDQFYILITDAQGRVVGGDERLGVPQNIKRFPAFRTMILEQLPVRVVTLQVPIAHLQSHPALYIQMAETFGERDRLTRLVLLNTLLHQFVLFLLVMGCVWVGVRRGMIPLYQLQEEVAKRSPTCLMPMDIGESPEEVRPLVRTLNDLMEQLQKYIHQQKRFVANAAHQLRTPLAGIQIQLELAEREQNLPQVTQALNQAQVGLDNAIHLTEQLLVLAKQDDPDSREFNKELVDLGALAAEVTASFSAMAEQRNIHLTWTRQENENLPVLIEGQPEPLKQLFSNLVHNALIYTPSAGTVEVSLENGPTLSVKDNGPGIPSEEREKVFERFYRLARNQAPGSGLGLSIAQEIAKAHHAKITIQDCEKSQGCIISVCFPEKSNSS